MSKMHSSERFWSASLAELKRGYREDARFINVCFAETEPIRGLSIPMKADFTRRKDDADAHPEKTRLGI